MNKAKKPRKLIKRDKHSEAPRVLSYREQILAIGRFVQFSSFVMALLGVLFVILFFLGSAQASVNELVVLISGFAFMGASFVTYVFYQLALRPYIRMKIQVFKDHLAVKKGKKKLIIDFNQVVKVKHSLGIGVNGWVKLILKNGKSFKFTTSLERADYIIEALYDVRQDLMDRASYLALRRLIVLSDHRFARHKEFFQGGRLFLTIFLIVGNPIFIASFILYDQKLAYHFPFHFEVFFKTFFVIFLICFLGVLLALYFADRKIDIARYSMLRKNIHDKRRDYSLERRAYLAMSGPYVFTLLLLLFPVYMYDLNLLSSVHLGNKANFLGLEKGEFLWVDLRSVCSDCNRPIKAGDIVLIEGNRIAKVFALPGQMVAINKREVIFKNGEKVRGRYLSALQEMEVAENHYALIGYQGENKFIASFDQIKGVVFRKLKKRKDIEPIVGGKDEVSKMQN